MDGLVRISPVCLTTLGDNTQMGVIKRGGSSRIILNLHLEFEGWLGDDLGCESSEYYVTDRLKKGIEESNLTGFFFDDLESSKAPYFEEMEPNVKLPHFFWLRIFGEIGKDDLSLFKNVDLIVSKKAMACFSAYNIQHAQIYPWSPPRGLI
jgi:hypothetical protein